MHELAAGQDTQKSWPVGTRGFGLGVIDHPAPEALAGAARTPTKSAAHSSSMNLFITIPPPQQAADGCLIFAPQPHKKLKSRQNLTSRPGKPARHPAPARPRPPWSAQADPAASRSSAWRHRKAWLRARSGSRLRRRSTRPAKAKAWVKQ